MGHLCCAWRLALSPTHNACGCLTQLGEGSFIMVFFSWQGTFGSLEKPKYVTISILQWLCGYFNSPPSPWNMELAKATGPVLSLDNSLCKNHFQYLSQRPAVFTRGPQCAVPLKTRCFVAQQLWHVKCNAVQAVLLENLITFDRNATIMFYTTDHFIMLWCEEHLAPHFILS